MEKDIRMKIAITGHRPDSLDKDYTYTSELWRYIYDELESTFRRINPSKIYTGMALGVDTVAAELAVKCDIPFVACIPFPEQAERWTPKQQAHYNLLLEYAENKVCVNPGPYESWKFQKRNEYMVDNSDLVVAVWTGWKGGTRNCVDYAIKQNQTVWRIDPKTRKVGRYDGTQIVSKQGVPA